MMGNDIDLFCERMRRKGFSATVAEVTGSTNTLLKKMAEDGAPEGSIAMAMSQTAGRGRMGRSFLSPEGGLYMSILLRPRMTVDDALLLTAKAAVAVCRVAERISGKKLSVKWVNDIYLDRRKLCGILCEGAFDTKGKLSYAVLGIGLNTVMPKGGFAPEVCDIATALFDGDAEFAREKNFALAEGIAEEFFALYGKLSDEECYAEYCRREILCGGDVTVFCGGVKTDAKAICVDSDYGLVVEYADGVREALHFGEASAKPKA